MSEHQAGPPPAEPRPPEGEATVVWYHEPPRPKRFGFLDKRMLLIGLAVVVVLGTLTAAIVFLPRTTGAVGGAPATSSAPSDNPPTGSSAPIEPASSSPVITPSIPVAPDFAAARTAVQPSLVRVLASTCQGAGVATGFWINDTTVLTSYQAVAKAVVLAIVTPDGVPVPATISGANADAGVALLSTANDQSAPPLTLASTGPASGDWVAAVGMPSRSSSVRVVSEQVGRTNVSLTHRGAVLSGFAEMPGKTNYGMGGAPVVTADGSVVGAVMSLADRDDQLIVPADQLRQAIDQVGNLNPPEPGTCKRPTGPHSETRIEGDLPTSLRKGLMAYFGGVNSADYAKAYKALGPRFESTNTLSGISRGWTSSYDFNIRVRSTSENGGVRKAWVTFDSIFVPKYGPSEETGVSCARWSLNYEFSKNGDRWEINRSRAHGGAEEAYTPC